MSLLPETKRMPRNAMRMTPSSHAHDDLGQAHDLEGPAQGTNSHANDPRWSGAWREVSCAWLITACAWQVGVMRLASKVRCMGHSGRRLTQVGQAHGTTLRGTGHEGSCAGHHWGMRSVMPMTHRVIRMAVLQPAQFIHAAHVDLD